MKLKRLRDIFLMFMACAFLGWIYEVPVGLLETHVGYVNRGFYSVHICRFMVLDELY